MNRWRLFLSLAVACLSTGAQAFPGFAEVRAQYRASDAWLLARDGRPLHSLRVDMQVRRLPWTRIEDVSPALLRALLASEDRQFYAHAGVDWSAAAASAWRNLWNTRTRGASTLTMQLVGLLDEDGKRQGRRSLTEKISQAAGALWLERHWQKDEILEAYLNLVSFRGELVGVAAMSRGLFGKWPDGLDEREAALAAALLRAPGASADQLVQRACGVLRDSARLAKRGEPTCEGLDALARLALTGGLKEGAFIPASAPQRAPHLAQKLLKQPGERLTTTLDADLQAFASQALHRQLRELARQNAEDGAVVVIDNASGEILAWVGSSGTLSEAPAVDGVVALRQAGSTLKPFLYGLAFERRIFTAASLIDDSPLSLNTANGLYVPQNYTAHYRGWVSARMALGGSLNIPAVRTLVRVTPDLFHQRLRQIGFASLTENGDYYGYSLALGSADVSLLMLANAYRTLANHGRWTPLAVTPDRRRQPCADALCGEAFTARPHLAGDAAAAFIVGDILADRSARAGTFGLESWLATPYWAAAKTGTSKDMRDNWCIGYTTRHTVAVWVGNASGEAMHDVSGVSGAAPVWREVVDWLNTNRKSNSRQTPPQPAPGLVRGPVRYQPPVEATRSDWFYAGSASSEVIAANREELVRITSPDHGSMVALDPDIPPDRQAIELKHSGKKARNWRWKIDGRPIGVAHPGSRWQPTPGRHKLALADAKGREIDAIDFEVRALRSGNRALSSGGAAR